MSLPPNSPLLTIISFGLGLLLLGGFLGGELAKKRQDKAEIKEIQKQQNELLSKLEESRKIALQNEQRALAHIDSIYQVLDVLAMQELNVRSEINRLRDELQRKRKALVTTKSKLSEQSKKSTFSFKND
ncbi:MAG: hypothetical protein SFV55_20400 [Haliscomenobacter sp.]|uniref:hypothetical protein n=1 Tax=Haliscomenobacter sp. TaxID=2717303 RepID=UPI0029AC881F|nr:hypothetical protein [Haliscomenobacter sp.]MDX2070802.1 hypothetical protein [Haliscomenobacter sp.]